MDNKAMASRVSSCASPAAQLMATFNIGMHVRKIDIRRDESYLDNVKFIKENFGDTVKILEPDLPPIHSGCGLVISEKGKMKDMDNEMKMAIKPAMDKVLKIQGEQGNFISWRQMQNTFDDQLSAYFTPMVDDDKYRMGQLDRRDGFDIRWLFGGDVGPRELHDAQKEMKEVVGDIKVWDMLKIDTDALKEMFANRGTSTVIGSDNSAKIAIDCGVIRFPIIDDPFFKLYRFRVIAVKTSTQVLILGLNSFNGLFMDYNERKYRASDSWTGKWKTVAAEQVDDMFEKMMAQYA